MAKKFNLNQILADVSKKSTGGEEAVNRSVDEIVRISIFDIVPSEDNFYSMNDIEELKGTIELAGKILQNLIVVPLEGGKYKAISGHRRRLASIALVEEGKPQYEFVPCIVEENEKEAGAQAIREEIMLIAANSQREKTTWDKIEEVRRTRLLLERVKKQNKISGVMRDIMAKALNTSPTQIGRYNAIINNLSPAFMDELKEDRINISIAYELSGLSCDEQKEQLNKYKSSGGEISIKNARNTKIEKSKVTPIFKKEKPNIVKKIDQSVEQLESLKEYCQLMGNSGDELRYWWQDVLVLETVIERLKKDEVDK